MTSSSLEGHCDLQPSYISKILRACYRLTEYKHTWLLMVVGKHFLGVTRVHPSFAFLSLEFQSVGRIRFLAECMQIILRTLFVRTVFLPMKLRPYVYYSQFPNVLNSPDFSCIAKQMHFIYFHFYPFLRHLGWITLTDHHVSNYSDVFLITQDFYSRRTGYSTSKYSSGPLWLYVRPRLRVIDGADTRKILSKCRPLWRGEFGGNFATNR